MTNTQKYLLYGIPALAVLYLGFKALKNASDEKSGKLVGLEDSDSSNFVDEKKVSPRAIKDNQRIKKAKQILNILNKRSKEMVYVQITANKDTVVYHQNTKKSIPFDAEPEKGKTLKLSPIKKSVVNLFGSNRDCTWTMEVNGQLIYRDNSMQFPIYYAVLDTLDWDFKFLIR